MPERGDIIWISLSPSEGQGRTGRRAAVALSPQGYNSRVALAIVCPISATIKGYPFEVPLPHGLPIEGAILADQAQSLDWRVRRAEPICSLPAATVEDALGKLRALLA